MAYSTLTRAELRDRIRGCLIGSAVGDAYGLATEFMSRSTVEVIYGNGPIAFGRDPGYPVWEDHHRSIADRNDFTDDTDQLLLILQSLQQTRDGKLDPVNFAHRLLEWLYQGIPEIGTDPGRGLGFTVGQVIHHPLFKKNPHRAAFEVWDASGRNLAPNGAVMRTAVLGIESFWDEPRVVENTMAAAKVTHADPRSVVSALVSSVLISRLLRGGGLDAVHDSTCIWNPKLGDHEYRRELLSYLQRGTNMQHGQFLNPVYPEATSSNQYRPKDYEALGAKLLEEEAQSEESYRAQLKNRSHLGWNMKRPQVIFRPDKGWSGIDCVGEDEAMGALARSVVADYKFLLQETDVAPTTKPEEQHYQERWATELEAHCFPQSLRQLELGEGTKIGYTFKCIGVAYYGATRRVDPSPTAPEYSGPAGLFRGVMEQVTLQGGDADTNDAVMGSLLGARFGLEKGIPTGWWTELQHLKWFEDTVDQFLDRVLSQYDTAAI
ncbi:ADP-ribosylglycohydrolase-domain-containing protein [Gamsiella multidivaricata]|uniref:ADP-ribosylglycohydrolase-domain-containing protein n=1 Tax=Gamsiella multidivaricata TaxID=101098 RepID=UPI00221F4C07|nr:ADP-ribosylglycohydrolase-domain-containing protein [Gamsiella multidivaricata]KAG0366818.1 hypothetical protein BGZ54_004842 [Gamsiella multidivaricata]KAI7816722.1 ADP-ribosylglycohydrolase-domain-containing protein [Gamsiella multidivaricata]